MSTPNTITIDGVEFVRKDSTLNANPSDYKIVRTQSAGVFAGYVESRKGQEVVMRQVRRLWYWEGAASLSQLAVDGTSKPVQCKFPVTVDRIELLQVVEILDVTQKACESIASVPVWSA